MPRKTCGECDGYSGNGRASMRPRPDAAENAAAQAVDLVRLCRASMRPRPDAAENPVILGRSTAPYRCFNEAAARCRGKHTARDYVRARLAMLQ